MHVLFLHPNFPAQFGHLAARLARRPGWRCTFVSERAEGEVSGVQCVRYTPAGGATRDTHYWSRTFENLVWHSDAAVRALAARPEIRPDLVVAHSGFVSAAFLRELYDCPVVNHFEYFYHPAGTDMDFRPDFPATPAARLRALARNAGLLLDLHYCDLGYSPTRWQHSLLPAEYRPKVRVAFDGIDTDLWKPRPGAPRVIAGWPVPDGVRIVTYVARGFESMRGFDVFMKMARVLCGRRSDVVFAVVGEDRVCYGGDADVTGGKSFKEWVLSRDEYDLSRFVFTGLLPPADLAQLLAVTDLHVYLTVPFVLSWSLFDALACGAAVLASDTAPAREVIADGRTGLLADFFDAEGLADRAGRVLDNPGAYRHLGRAGCELVRERYSLDACVPRMLDLYDEARYARRQSRGGSAGPVL